MFSKFRSQLKPYKDWFFMTYFLPLAGCVAMGISSDQLFYRTCFFIAAFFLLLKFWVTDYKLIEIFFMGTVMALLGYVYIRTSEKALIITALSIFGCKDVSVKKVLKYTLFVYIIGMLLTISMVKLGMVEGQLHSLTKSGIQYKINDYGFSHPNSAYSHLLMIALMIVAVWQERLRWYHYCILTLAMFIAYQVFLSRTGFLIYLLLCIAIGVIYIRKWDRFKRIFFSLFNIMPLGIFVLSYVLMVCYQKGILFANKLNDFVTGRIMLSSKAYQEVGLSLFGSLEKDWKVWLFIDNAYLNVLFSCGIIVCILGVISYSIVCFQYWKAREYFILVILGIISIYSFMEYSPVNATWNPLLLFMSGTLLWKKGEKRTEGIDVS